LDKKQEGWVTGLCLISAKELRGPEHSGDAYSLAKAMEVIFLLSTPAKLHDNLHGGKGITGNRESLPLHLFLKLPRNLEAKSCSNLRTIKNVGNSYAENSD
jgi:hypothetical protein